MIFYILFALSWIITLVSVTLLYQSSSRFKQRCRMEELMTVQRDISIQLGQSYNIEDAAYTLLGSILKVKPIDACGIYLFDPSKNRFQLTLQNGFLDEYLEKFNEIDLEDTFFKSIKIGTSLTMQGNTKSATIFIPIQNKGNILAIVAVSSTLEGIIPPVIQKMLESLCVQIGGILARTYLENRGSPQ